MEELKNIIKKIEEKKSTDSQKMMMLRNCECLIDYKIIKNYLKSSEKAKDVEKKLLKLLPIVKIVWENDICFLKVEKDGVVLKSKLSKSFSKVSFMINLKCKSLKKIEDLLDNLTDIWRYSDGSLEFYEIIGLKSNDEYKNFVEKLLIQETKTQE